MEMQERARVAVIDVDKIGSRVGYDGTYFGSAEEFLSWPNIDQMNCLIIDVRLPGTCRQRDTDLSRCGLVHDERASISFRSCWHIACNIGA
jgi:hypothetical protein